MSRGIGAYANKILEDNETVIYEYGGYNLNAAEYRNENHLCDGSITIPKRCFAEPEVHQKLKKMPSGRKKLVAKRIPVSVDYGQMLENGLIKVENCSNCWEITEDNLHVDVMVCHLLFKLFYQYQEDGIFPEHVSYNV